MSSLGQMGLSSAVVHALNNSCGEYMYFSLKFIELLGASRVEHWSTSSAIQADRPYTCRRFKCVTLTFCHVV